MTRTTLSIFTGCSTLILFAMNAHSQTITFTSLPSGYTADSISLPQPFAGALGTNPNQPGIVYAAVGAFDDMEVVRVDLETGASATVASGPFGTIGGIAVFSATEIILVENDGAPATSLPTETILIARDNNPEDGDFDDPGEITELIAPILAGGPFGFTGTQARIAPAGNAAAIPAGSLLVQTADGGGDSEILVVEDPLTSPAFRPSAGAFYSGFDFNGGFDFDSAGNVFMGTLEGTGFTGEVQALVNTNADDQITTDELNLILVGENGMSDLVIDAEDDVLFVGYDESFIASIRTFKVPADPLNDTVSATTLAQTDSGFLSAIAITSKSLPFEPGAEPPNAAQIVISGFDGGFSPAINLLVLTPAPLARALHWSDYE